ncbi:MAG: serine/threonine-protein kinase [Polyangiaceae bacterium]
MAEERTEPDHRPDHVRRGAPPPPEPPPSLERLGRYQLLFELARGGMGRVHVARAVGPHGFGRVLAVKRPLTADASREERAAFLGEARVSARIHHPNVVETLDLGEHDGLPYIARAFVPGVSLARLLARAADRGERLDPWLVAWIVQEIAAGLDAAHELTGESGEPLGLVHRDVSPENVLLSFEGRVLVTDFGVAKWRRDGAATRADAVKGKLAYMSPEQARGERARPPHRSPRPGDRRPRGTDRPPSVRRRLPRRDRAARPRPRPPTSAKPAPTSRPTSRLS